MPTYDMQCKDCGERFEVSRAFSDIIIVYCPKCRGNNIRRLWHTIPVMFRGKGFYKTDHPKEKK